MNVNAEAVSKLEQSLSMPLSQRARVVLTAGCSVVLMLVIWVLLIALLDRPMRSFGNLVWSGSLWLSALLSPGIIAHSRYAVRPVLACTIGFVVFGLVFMACEGPTFDLVSQVGDPARFQRLAFHLSLLPAGVFAAARCGRWIAHRRHDSKATDRANMMESVQRPHCDHGWSMNRVSAVIIIGCIGFVFALPRCASAQVNGRDARESLQAEFAKAREEWAEKFILPASDEERAALMKADPSRLFEPRFLQLARDHAAESTALDAAEWLCENAEPGPILDEGLAIVQRHHLSDVRVGELCRRLGQQYSPKVEQFLSTIAEKHADRYTRGVALLCLGHFESNLRDTAISARNNPQFLAWARSNIQQTELDWILAADPEKCAARVDAVCMQIQEEYGDLVNKTASEQTGRVVTLTDSAKALQFSLHAVGSVAPEIAGKSGTGADVRLSDFEGKVVLLMFSANWCGPCKAKYGQLRELMRLYADKPFTVMTVMADQSAATVSAAVMSGEITWPAIWDGENGPIATAWNVTGYPTIYLIDRDGQIVKENLRDDALDDEVPTLLGIDPAVRVRPDKRNRVWSLSLRNQKLGGDELPELLKGYTELRELDLSDNPIGDAALQHLVPLQKLQTLRLQHTGISDAGLRLLKELPSLKQLHLDAAPGHMTTESGRRELRKSLPGLQIYLITN